MPQVGLGVFQTPPRHRTCGGDRAGRRLPTHRHRRSILQRARGRSGGRRVRRLRARTSSGHQSCGTPTRATTARSRRSTPAWIASAFELPRPVPHPLADAGARTRSSTRSRRSRTCATRAGSGRSESATSSPNTCGSWSTATGIVPAVNQIELHPLLQQAGVAGSARSAAASPPRRGVRWARDHC